ncbi:hypothetical protein SLEP1_g38891 [Rubroshorea leprosula]|uniref:Uncharacterized protein n=1 Tax=Rubroshorea leprosula TaxID=152421 RepID=A0AAV5KZ57_9ROSI|nr:hypothetical protein SLEP1_g38891 [Rubroshorea leprosula]
MATGPHGAGTPSPSPSPSMAGTGIPAGNFGGGSKIASVPIPAGTYYSPRGPIIPRGSVEMRAEFEQECGRGLEERKLRDWLKRPTGMGTKGEETQRLTREERPTGEERPTSTERGMRNPNFQIRNLKLQEAASKRETE